MAPPPAPPPVPPPSQPPHNQPSQAGRFKPRAKKPAKKIRVGEASGVVVPAAAPPPGSVSEAVGSSILAGAPGRGRGGGGGRGGRGRGGQRGAGRGGVVGGGRGAVVQGEAFFQASPLAGGKKASGSYGRSSAASRDAQPATAGGARGEGGRGGASQVRQEAEASEEIVGILEKGVGAAAAAEAEATGSLEDRSKSLGPKPGRVEDPEEGVASARTIARKPRSEVDSATSGVYYDDDSSSDDDDVEPSSSSARRSNCPKPPTSELLQPIVLPEPTPRSSEPSSSEPTRPESVTSGGDISRRCEEEDAHLPMLALASKLRGARIQQPTIDDDKWLLVQLPTRLPPLKQATVAENPSPDHVSSGDDPRWYHQQAAGAAAVSLPSVRRDRFDDALRGSVPGRLGKLVLYRSGKAALVLEDPEGEPAVRMNVVGRRCSHFQQAVAIDAEAQKLVVLGSVRQSVVATPDLGPA